MKINLIVLKVVACLSCWCRGKTFSSPSKYCLTTLMAFKIPNVKWAVGHSFNLYVGLQRPGWFYLLGNPPRADVRLWTPRARATDVGQGLNLRTGSGWTPCVPRSREHEERPAAGRAKMPTGQKNTCVCMYICVQGSPSGCVWREILGVTQVDEKGHEGNTAVVTAYLRWRKHGERNSRTRVPAGYYYLLWTLYHTPTAILLSIIIYFEHYCTRTAVGRRWRLNHRVVISSTQDRAWEQLPSEVNEIVSYRTESGHISRRLVSGKYLSITK